MKTFVVYQQWCEAESLINHRSCEVQVNSNINVLFCIKGRKEKGKKGRERKEGRGKKNKKGRKEEKKTPIH